MSKRTSDAQLAPHSWSLVDWPPAVYPHNASKGRYLVRSNRDSLVKAGALTRIGRDLVILGAPFCRWLESQSRRVDAFPQIAPNRRATVDQAAA
jgi:hypothetical protein